MKHNPLREILLFAKLQIVLIFILLSNDAYGDTNHKNSFGVGLGLHYGVIGFSYDRFVKSNIAVTVSTGVEITSAVHNIGVKYYLRRKSPIFQPRLSVLLGTNAWADFNCAETALVCSQTESYYGVTLGAGTAMVFGSKRRHIIDFDLVVRAFTLQLEDDRQAAVESGAESDETWRFFFSLGYRFRY